MITMAEDKTTGRRPIAVVPYPFRDSHPFGFLVYCDDGSIWLHDVHPTHVWQQVSTIPGSSAAAK
jgi:hypothetical protein